MEEKGVLENIISVTEKVLSGLPSLGRKDISKQLQSFSQIIKQFPEQKKFSKNDFETLHKIFTAIARPEIAKQFLSEVDTEKFYAFGKHLIKHLSKQFEQIRKITHEYLNLFRFPCFLRRIYDQSQQVDGLAGEQKWEKLIHDLILKSNYHTGVLFNQRLRDYKNKTLFKVIRGNSVTEYSWEKSAKLIKNYQQSFHELLRKEISDSHGRVAFLLENCLEMALLDLACLTGGIVNVMIPANSVTEHIRFMLIQCKVNLIVVHNEKLLSKIKSIKNDLPDLKHAVLLEGNSIEEWVISFSEFMKLKSENSAEFEIDMQSLATIMYTSGTTGEPKGIMFSQMNIIYKRFCRAMAIPEIGEEDRFLAFLPLYHTFGRYLEMTGSVFWAAEYCFLENPSVETMITNMQLVKPSVFISIPKKWMQLYDYVTSKVDVEVEEHIKIKSELEAATGGNLKWGLSAAGYLPPDIFQFFQNYGVELMSGFGMTEATGGITMTPWKKYKPNSLGNALPGIEIKLGEDGEIMIKGPYVMLGYYETDNSETFTEDGWLPTGDVMKMDEDGFIEIIDRKKEIYKNTRGETIAPQKIENLFRDFENVKQVFLAGDHRQFNTLLIYPNFEDKNSPLHSMDEKQIQEYFSSVVVTVNKFLSPFERILDYRLIDRPFSDEHGELTPKGTYKRKIIEKNFSKQIESMYMKNHTLVYIRNTEVRIPNWFLREKGTLSRDINTRDDAIVIPKLKLSLNLHHTDEQNIFRIGSYNYSVSTPFIDLQTILTDPLLWIGNKELTDFAGSSIVQWYRQTGETTQIKFHSLPVIPEISESAKLSFKKINSSNEISLDGIHLAYLLILSGSSDLSINPMKYFKKILDDPKNTHYNLVLNLISRPNITGNKNLKRELFSEALKRAGDKKFGEIFIYYFNNDVSVLITESIGVIVENVWSESKLSFIETYIKQLLETESVKGSDYENKISSLFELITTYGIRHPRFYRRVRRFLMRFAVLSEFNIVKDLTNRNLLKLRNGLREWLGQNQKVAVDAETGEEYGWEDVLAFEGGIDPEDRIRIKNALIKTSILREAIFMFSNGIRLRLDDILPGGIWIGLLESKTEKSIYRLTVQTRYQGGFDVTLHLNKNLPPALVAEEIKWLILAGTNLRGERLLPHFGGYWDEYELWTEAFVPRDSLVKYLERESKRKDNEYEQRLRELWPHFVWNAASAYMNFWKLTNYTIELTNPSPENITIPAHDYQTGTLLYSVSKRTPSNSSATFFLNFYNLFVKKTLAVYPFLLKQSILNYIFSGITECEGEDKAVALINQFLEEINSIENIEEKSVIIKRAKEFVASIQRDGFIPKSLFFAIKRFHRWRKLNPDANISAQAEMLYELYETYQLFDLESDYPSTRTIFYLRTVLSEAKENLNDTLKEIAEKQRFHKVTKEEVQKLYSELHSLPELSEAEEFFLTRLSYPHLKPKDTAALLTVGGFGVDSSNLVIQLRDEENNQFIIRNPVSPKEISKLHALYLESNLTVNFKAEHKFLVALSERGFIIGGLYYSQADENTAHMEKIVVSSRYRRKGISEALMNELFNRLKAEHFKFVTTGFFRPEYFYKFGFKVEKKYSGLFLDLQNFNDKL